MTQIIKRFLMERLDTLIEPNKVLVLYGPRQVGKTTLISEYLKDYSGKVLQTTGDDSVLRAVFAEQNLEKIKSFVAGYDILFIDEAQKIPNIGIALKMVVDHVNGIKVIATGSSSFDLSNKVGEPLVGRQWVRTLYPIAVFELIDEFGGAYMVNNLEQTLVYGTYPVVLTTKNNAQKMDYLIQIRDSYLYKDLFLLEEVQHKDKMLDLLRLLAFQIGKEVSLKELSNSLDISRNTVERYLYLLEQAFVIRRVGGYSGNLRKEVTKMDRYYFYDLGVRNAVIGNFHPLHARNDVGALWENFLFIERLKKREYKRIYANEYFWRTWDKKEVDLVEERDGKLFGYEFKWNTRKLPKAPKDWLGTYDNASYEVITPENYLEFII